MDATLPDLLRLLAVPALGWAAHHDVRTRRVPNRLWTPLAALGVVLLAWEALTAPAYARTLFFVRVGVSLLVIPLAYLFWATGGFGGADFKAFAVVALLFPTYPHYYVADVVLPLHPANLGVFSVTVVTNAMLASLAYPAVLAARNAAAGEVSPRAFVGRRVAVADLPGAHGSLLEDGDGFTRNGLDLDALRMYLRWRGATLADLRTRPERLRDPASLPVDPGDPTDGAVLPPGVRPETDGGRGEAGPTASEPAASADALPGAGDAPTDGGDRGADADADGDANARASGGIDPDPDDSWGAAAFLADVEGDAYGTTPRALREGLDLVAERDAVWVTPGIPFVVPILAGLLVGLVYGDLLYALLRAVALA